MSAEHGTMDYVRKVLTDGHFNDRFETTAILAGWIAAREHNMWDISTSDAIVKATLENVQTRLIEFLLT
jgi:hypothetical protein